MHYLFLIVIFKDITPMLKSKNYLYKKPTIEELSVLKLCYRKLLKHFIILKKKMEKYLLLIKLI